MEKENKTAHKKRFRLFHARVGAVNKLSGVKVLQRALLSNFNTLLSSAIKPRDIVFLLFYFINSSGNQNARLKL